MKKISYIVLTLLMMLSMASCNAKPKAKYVFLFIGDGMGFGAVSVTETYLAQADGGMEQGMAPLAFTGFPVLGAASTFSANSQVTDSSAGGTALSTGTKVNNHTMAITPEGDTLTSITYKIHDAGFKVGVAATVCIDHATPGSFYGHNESRSNYYEIGSELGQSGFEFFGGGDFNNPNREGEPSCYEKAEAAGYTIAYGREEFDQKKADTDKIVFFQKREEGRAMNDIPTYLARHDRNNPDDICLAEIVEKGIEFLDNDKGFFMMAEGSKIDYAAHSNALPGLIYETIDMSNAVEVALEFYKKHPKNTLIVVTADHETGGPACRNPRLSIVKGHCLPEQMPEGYVDEAAEGDISDIAGIGWITGNHTGDRVPVFAIGAGSEMFAGCIDNTDIPRRICKAMGVEF